jgi:hypothetical protein
MTAELVELTLSDGRKIRPYLEHGDPLCSLTHCPLCSFYGGTGQGTYLSKCGFSAIHGSLCVPAVLCQRDDLKATLCDLEEGFDDLDIRSQHLEWRLREARRWEQNSEEARHEIAIQRDDARRKQLVLEVLATGFDARKLAEERGWFYLYEKEERKDNV